MGELKLFGSIGNMKNQLKTPNDWAREFKLHNCIDNPRFAKQIRAIQENAINSKKNSDYLSVLRTNLDNLKVNS